MMKRRELREKLVGGAIGAGVAASASACGHGYIQALIQAVNPELPG